MQFVAFNFKPCSKPAGSVVATAASLGCPRTPMQEQENWCGELMQTYRGKDNKRCRRPLNFSLRLSFQTFEHIPGTSVRVKPSKAILSPIHSPLPYHVYHVGRKHVRSPSACLPIFTVKIGFRILAGLWRKLWRTVPRALSADCSNCEWVLVCSIKTCIDVLQDLRECGLWQGKCVAQDMVLQHSGDDVTIVTIVIRSVQVANTPRKCGNLAIWDGMGWRWKQNMKQYMKQYIWNL